jgi:hypothetical protein
VEFNILRRLYHFDPMLLVKGAAFVFLEVILRLFDSISKMDDKPQRSDLNLQITLFKFWIICQLPIVELL